jgi:hypothetical protein
MQVKCLLHQEITKERNLKEHQTSDDGNLLQSASPKTLVYNYTRFGLCVMCMAPLLMLIDSFKQKRNTERESHKYMAEKKRLELFSLGI